MNIASKAIIIMKNMLKCQRYSHLTMLLEEQQESLPKLAEANRVDVDSKELNDLFEEENWSTFVEPEETSEEVEKTIPEMTLWGDVHEELQSEKMRYILEVEEIVLALNENEKVPIVEKEHATLRPLMLKQLHDRHLFFLGKHGRKNDPPYRSLKSQVGL